MKLGIEPYAVYHSSGKGAPLFRGKSHGQQTRGPMRSPLIYLYFLFRSHRRAHRFYIPGFHKALGAILVCYQQIAVPSIHPDNRFAGG